MSGSSCHQSTAEIEQKRQRNLQLEVTVTSDIDIKSFGVDYRQSSF